MSGAHYPQFCALARAAEILGERWTLLIVRELLLGPKRFADLVDRLSGVSPTVLTQRLTALIESGVIRRATLPAPFNAQVYELTSAGLALKPAIYALIRWGGHFLFPMREDDAFEPEWVLLGLDAIALRSASPNKTLALRVVHKTKSARVLVVGGPEGTRLTQSEAPAAATIEARFDTLLRVISRAIPLERAVDDGLARVEGAIGTARLLPRFFDLRPPQTSISAGRKQT